jgi:biotin transport system substrate-specific component
MSLMSENASSRALVTAVWPDSTNELVKWAVLIIGGILVLTLSAKIKVPFYPVPMTLQTFAVMALAAAYGSRMAVLTVLAYLLAGALGLPVFTNTPPALAGPTYFLGPTGGFLVGFILLALIVGSATDRGWDRSIPKLFAAMVAADIVVFALGFVWLAWFAQLSNGSGLGIESAFMNGVVPFLLADLLKIALAALAIPMAWRLIEPESI